MKKGEQSETERGRRNLTILFTWKNSIFISYSFSPVCIWIDSLEKRRKVKAKAIKIHVSVFLPSYCLLLARLGSSSVDLIPGEFTGNFVFRTLRSHFAHSTSECLRSDPTAAGRFCGSNFNCFESLFKDSWKRRKKLTVSFSLPSAVLSVHTENSPDDRGNKLSL